MHTNLSPTKIVTFATIALLLAACSSPVPPSAGNSTVPDNNKPAETAMTITEKDLAFIKDPTIKKHFLAQFNLKTMRIKSTSDGRGTTQITELDNSSTSPKVSMIELDGKKTTMALIKIDKTTYMQNPKDGQWWYEVEVEKPISPAKEATSTADNLESKIKETQEILPKEADQPSYKLLGEEACGGTLTCYKYEEVQKDGSKRTFWISKSDYLLRKEIASFGEFSSTVEYSYDNINIVAPANAKMVPGGKSVYEVVLGFNLPDDAENVEEIIGE